MDELYDRQIELLTKLRTCFSNFNERDSKTKGIAEAQMNRLQTYYEDACENHEKFRSRKTWTEHKYHDQSVWESIEDAYYDGKGLFNDFFHDLEIAARAALPPSPSLNQTIKPADQPIAYHNLPKIDLKIFSGKQCDWEEFRDHFRSLIHRNDILTPLISCIICLRM